ncbi:hypothetical protein SH580_08670 [Coraliomargarita algicola]|uniref:Uncharacterized protein n=1 Tax=Coraliomargarita algicola TaxID=3092156 RepID=A0ABZ0RRI3_9BACT|nr:hypothetical protein [Coraliomargarita sp. J2-16]WPJ97783.1 hypothetical protein SH580_08670 [Coraliomargarita sp. J2-16]
MSVCSPLIFPVFCAHVLLLAYLVPLVGHGQWYVAAEDEAYYDAYADGWQTGDWGGRGFKGWQLFAPEYGIAGEEQYAGFFIADADQEADLGAAAREGRAFGIYANGTGFEETVAFRSFERPLIAGDVFSLRFEFDGFGHKFERDAEGVSSVGIALRHADTATDLSELSQGRALVLAVIEGLSTYQILDAGGRFNTRVFLDPAGIEIGVTIGEAGLYKLQITTLSDQVLHEFPQRRMSLPVAEDAPVRIKSFALFNLNGGVHNAYYGAFQISRLEGDR